MNNWFDDLSKALASSVSRRDMFRWVGAGGLAAVLASLGLKNASAQPEEKCPLKSSEFTDPCFDQTTCSQDPFCTCLPRVRAQAALCHEPVFCAGLVPCDSDADCTGAGLPGPEGQWRCAFSCCGGFAQAFCHPRCGSGLGAFASPGITGGNTSIGRPIP
jgi:hypothetical protein